MKEQKCLTCNRMIDYEWAINNEGLCGVCGPLRQQNRADRETGQDAQQRQGSQEMPPSVITELDPSLRANKGQQTTADENQDEEPNPGDIGFLDRLLEAIENYQAIDNSEAMSNPVYLHPNDWLEIRRLVVNLQKLSRAFS